MEKANTSINLADLVARFIEQAQTLLVDPAFWIQFLVIGIVFTIN